VQRLNLIGIEATEDEKQTLRAHQFFEGPESIRVTPFTESKQFSLGSYEQVEEYIEYIVFDYILDGKLTNELCPTIIIKDMLNRGVIKLKKGQIKRLHGDLKRAQVRSHLPDRLENFAYHFSVSKQEKSGLVTSSVLTHTRSDSFGI
jgi:hypothetical protein